MRVLSDSEAEFDVTDDAEKAIPVDTMDSAHKRMTNNLDHVDLTALRASEVQEVLSRAGALHDK